MRRASHRTFLASHHKTAARLTVQRRTGWVLAAVLLALGLLTVRLVDLQLRQAAGLRFIALRQTARMIVVPPQRGEIYDRQGRPLAVSVPAQSVFADPSMVPDKQATARQMAAILDLDDAAVRRRLESPGRFVWIARRIDDSAARRLARLDLPGIGLAEEDRRVYPNGPLAGIVIGVTGAENQGLAGIELAHDRVLTGEPGRVHVLSDAVGRELVDTRRVIVPVLHGSSLVLTVDAVIQHIAERELEMAVRRSGARRGLAIVIDPRDGEVLALVGIPEFHPSQTESRDPRAWRNPAISDVYEPGSTFKIILAAAALDSGAVDPADRFLCRGTLRAGGRVIRDAEQRPGGHGAQTLADVIKNSCNVGAALVGMQLGKARMMAALTRFGFDRPTGIDLPGEAAGLIPPLAQWYDPTLQTISFGQGISVTPLQLLVAASSVANGGLWVRPRVVRAIRGPAGDMTPLTLSPPRHILKETTARAVMEMLVGAVAEGTGKAAALDGYPVAGKTGTAQKPGPDGYIPGKYVASFLGFVPADLPRLAILVVIDEPRGAYYGGEVAAPVFASIALPALRYLGIPPLPGVSGSRRPP